MVEFLSSLPGMLTVAGIAISGAALLTAVFLWALREDRRVASEGAAAPLPHALLAALLLAAAAIVPTLFTIAARDVFVLPKLTALRVALVVALLVFGWSATRSPVASPIAPSRITRALDLSAILFVGLTALATILSIDPGHSLVGEGEQYQGLLTTLLYVAFFYLARAALADRRRLELLAVATTAGGTVVAVYAVVQQLRLDPLWSTLDKGRVFSTIGQAEWLAAYLVLCVPLAVALLWRARSAWRLAVGAALLLMVAALLLTLSRGGYLGLITLTVVFAIAVARDVHPTRRWLIAVPALGIAVMLVGIVPPLRQQAVAVWQRAISTADLAEGSIRDRLDLWSVGAAITVDHPLLGTGPETFPLVFPRYRDRVLADRRAFWLAYRPESPHNVYLATMAGAGIPALVAELALIGTGLLAIVRTSRRTRDRSVRILIAAVLAAVTGHLVTDMFMTAEVTGSWLAWLLLGAGVGYATAFDATEGIREAPSSPG